MQDLGRILILTGLFIIAIGGILIIGSKLGLGRLPGDFVILKAGVRIYLPLATSLLLSLLLSLLIRLFRK